VELAFIAALQHLPARQRAALILRDVLGFSAKEVGEALASTPTSVNSDLQRARRTFDERLPETSQPATLRTLGDGCVRDMVERFTSAFEQDDVTAIVALLSEDAKFAMPPYPRRYLGREAIADSWLMPGGPPPRLRYVSTSANGQPALGTCRLDRDAGSYLPLALDVLTLRGSWIAEAMAFRTPEVFPRFGLPAELD
jgi:RNA polymerase sigma-70 factor, ECF subfamily